MKGVQNRDQSEPRFGFALKRRGLEVYGEAAFRYFVEIERERAGRAGRPFLVVLVEVKAADGSVERMTGSTAEGVFEALGRTIRETDLIGWHREDTIAGAVLTELSIDERAELRPVLERIRRVADERLPLQVVTRLDVRISDGADEDGWS
jgi:hypothetical protein